MSDKTGQCMIRGYASLFSVADLSGDVMEPGAFAKSLQRASQLAMLWQHQSDNPVGSWTVMREDSRGLYVEGHLTEGVTRADEASALIADGTLSGLSIGFHTRRSRKQQSSGHRHILEAELWEISLVTFPMLPQARIFPPLVRHTTEAILRDAAGRLRASL